MGIKHLTIFLRNHFATQMYEVRKGVKLSDINVQIDNLMIDMNGVFHNSAQKVYEYGNHKPQFTRRLLGREQPKQVNKTKKQQEMFENVCSTIDNLVNIVDPKKKLILCVDGCAPIAKQCQQRQRRFKSANDPSSEKMPFETSSITPGTKFMDYLTKYVDWYIRYKMSTDSRWQSFEVVFSNEKAPGEGEQKCINYIRKYGDKSETYCINGLDADLIMLALGTHIPKFYVLREDIYNAHNDFLCINIEGIREILDELMFWESDTYEYSKKTVIDDFIFMCFIVGNDFVPHIPSIEIIQDGIELMMEIYKQVGRSYGHLTETIDGNLVFRPSALKVFLGTLGNTEKQNFENKLRKKDTFFPDSILNECAAQNASGVWNVDIDKYNRIYHQEKFGDTTDLCKLSHSYIEGMQWVLTYYTKGVPNWNWFFPYYYAPTASLLAKHIDTYVQPKYGYTQPNTPFQQLLCVLPPSCAHLIPSPLCNLITQKDSLLKKFYPDTITIDLAGKRREWEGIVVLPMVDTDLVRQEYFKYIDAVDAKEIRRNIVGRSFIYIFDSKHGYIFPSHYGEIKDCRVRNVVIDI